MSWMAAVPQIALALAILLAPGLLVIWALGTRGIVAVGAAPAISAAVVAIAAVVAQLVGVPFTVLPVLAVTAGAAALALAARRLLRGFVRSGSDPGRVWLGWTAGLVVAAALLTWRVTTSLISPDLFSQRFDIVFHLNAIRRVLDGDGSSLTMGALTGDTGILSFYPAAWHDIAALVAQLGPGSGMFTIPVAVSATNLAIAAVVWPLGCLALVRAIAGPRPLALGFTGVFAAAFGAFPLRLLEWGVVLPYFFGVALLPAALALVIAGCRLRPSAGLDAARAWILVVPVLAGLGLSHTSAVTALVALSAPPVVAAVAVSIRRRRARGRAVTLPIALTIGYAGVLAVVWIAGRPKNGFPGWDTPHSLPVALGAFLVNAPLGGTVPFAALAAILIAVGVLLLRRERWWFLGVFAVTGVLYVVVAGAQQGMLRRIVAGPWYEDTYRIAALVVIPGVVAASLGADLAARWIGLQLARRRRYPARAAALGAAALLVVALVPLTQVAVARDARLTRAAYVLSPSSELISTDELTLLSRIGADVPADAVIADNPWDGSALAYAFADRRMLFYHLLHESTDDQQVIAKRLNQAATDPEVCAVVKRLGIGYVLDFGAPVMDSPGAYEYAGLQGLVAAGVAEEVDREGDAVLYRITVCD